VTGISANVALDSGFSAAINYSMLDTDLVNGDATHWGIGASYTFDAITVHANYGSFDYDAGSPISADRDGYGLSAAYDFGGGLSAHIGYGYGETGAAPAVSTWSLGLNMSF
jgi:outer membrane protein OmpU